MSNFIKFMPYNDMVFAVIFLIYLILPVIVFILLFFIKAPYGKFASKSWGFLINARLGWVIMESFSVVIFVLFMLFYYKTLTLSKWAFFIIWNIHYVYRAFIYQVRLSKQESMSLGVALSGLSFQVFNTLYQCLFIFLPAFDGIYTNAYISKVNFIIGVIVFFLGLFINRHSDAILFNIKKNNGGKYAIPYGGMYKYITCPNYFGETLMWAGWFIMTLNLASLGFLIWTVSNLFPRAYSYYKWYKKEFPDYPKERKIVIPFLW